MSGSLAHIAAPIFVCLAMAGIAIGQEPQKQLPPLEARESWVYYADSRLSEKIIILLDVSPSMNCADALTLAVSKLQQMLSFGVENCSICLIMFDNMSHIYYPADTDNIWIQIPDGDGYLPKLLTYLRGLKTSNAVSTDPRSALERAVRLADPKTSILLVSDGIFSNRGDPIAVPQFLAELQNNLFRQKGFHVPVFCYGIGFRSQSLLDIATSNSGWYILRAAAEVIGPYVPPFTLPPR